MRGRVTRREEGFGDDLDSSPEQLLRLLSGANRKTALLVHRLASSSVTVSFQKVAYLT